MSIVLYLWRYFSFFYILISIFFFHFISRILVCLATMYITRVRQQVGLYTKYFKYSLAFILFLFLTSLSFLWCFSYNVRSYLLLSLNDGFLILISSLCPKLEQSLLMWFTFTNLPSCRLAEKAKPHYTCTYSLTKRDSKRRAGINDISDLHSNSWNQLYWQAMVRICYLIEATWFSLTGLRGMQILDSETSR